MIGFEDPYMQEMIVSSIMFCIAFFLVFVVAFAVH